MVGGRGKEGEKVGGWVGGKSEGSKTRGRGGAVERKRGREEGKE